MEQIKNNLIPLAFIGAGITTAFIDSTGFLPVLCIVAAWKTTK